MFRSNHRALYIKRRFGSDRHGQPQWETFQSDVAVWFTLRRRKTVDPSGEEIIADGEINFGADFGVRAGDMVVLDDKHHTEYMVITSDPVIDTSGTQRGQQCTIARQNEEIR